jgi:hypothetical protein
MEETKQYKTIMFGTPVADTDNAIVAFLQTPFFCSSAMPVRLIPRRVGSGTLARRSRRT